MTMGLMPDGNPDGIVRFGDIISVLRDYGKKPGAAGYDKKKNFNSNPKIDLGIVLTVLSHYGNCPTS